MKKKLGIILLAVTLIMSMSACSSSNSKEGDTSAELSDITFVLDWTPNTNHTGIYVALEKGYYEDAGLNVDVVQPSDSGAEALVGSGKAQFGISFQDTQASNWVSDDPMPFTTVAALPKSSEKPPPQIVCCLFENVQLMIVMKYLCFLYP